MQLQHLKNLRVQIEVFYTQGSLVTLIKGIVDQLKERLKDLEVILRRFHNDSFYDLTVHLSDYCAFAQETACQDHYVIMMILYVELADQGVFSQEPLEDP